MKGASLTANNVIQITSAYSARLDSSEKVSTKQYTTTKPTFTKWLRFTGVLRLATEQINTHLR